MNPSPNNAGPGNLPTSSLYLQDALEGAGLVDDWSPHQSGPYSFRFDDRLIVIRYVTEEEITLAHAVKERGGRIIYLIDDDLEAIVEDQRLPKDYRQRIGSFLSGAWQKLKDLIDEVVVSSRGLSDLMRRRGFDSVSQLDPFWPIPSEIIKPSDQSPQIAWLCTRSHIADLESIADELAGVLEQHRNARLTVLSGKQCPRYLRKMRGIVNRDPLPWPDYRRWLSRQRFDLALYPLLDTPVNRSRSINKFLEHTMTGAASLISPNAPFAERLADGDCAFADTGKWSVKLDELLSVPALRAEFASRAQARAREITDAARTRQLEFWKERLPLTRISA